jgi:hypothetical protein
MRKLAVPTAALVALGAITFVAQTAAQDPAPPPTLTVDAKVTPNKAGTKSKPQAVRLSGSLHIEHVPGYERPIVTRFKLWFPQGSLYNGGKYPKCSLKFLDRNKPADCPKGSIMGKASGVAWADTVITRPKVTIVNGGAKSVCLYTVLNNPARVQACVPGTIKKKTGKWKYEVTLTVPRVLQVVAGVPISLTDATWSAGSTTKDWLASTSCPKGNRWPYRVETFYSTGGSDTYDDSVACRR